MSRLRRRLSAMSLRRRIAGAAALAVAAVAVTMGVIGYLSTRSHLLGELHDELRARAAPFLKPHERAFGTSGGAPGAHGQQPAGETGVPPGGGPHGAAAREPAVPP